MHFINDLMGEVQANARRIQDKTELPSSGLSTQRTFPSEVESCHLEMPDQDYWGCFGALF